MQTEPELLASGKSKALRKLMKRMLSTIGCAVVLVGALTLSNVPAMAAGCGGYVNLAVWGCAPWDNNDKNKQPIKAKAPAAEPERVVKLGPGNTPPGFKIMNPGTAGPNYATNQVGASKTVTTAAPASSGTTKQTYVNPVIQGPGPMKLCPIPGSLNGKRPC